MGTAQQENPVTTLHLSWNAASDELRKAAEAIEAHPLSLETGLFYADLEQAAESLIRMGPEAFWTEIQEDIDMISDCWNDN